MENHHEIAEAKCLQRYLIYKKLQKIQTTNYRKALPIKRDIAIKVEILRVKGTIITGRKKSDTLLKQSEV